MIQAVCTRSICAAAAMKTSLISHNISQKWPNLMNCVLIETFWYVLSVSQISVKSIDLNLPIVTPSLIIAKDTGPVLSYPCVPKLPHFTPWLGTLNGSYRPCSKFTHFILHTYTAKKFSYFNHFQWSNELKLY